MTTAEREAAVEAMELLVLEMLKARYRERERFAADVIVRQFVSAGWRPPAQPASEREDIAQARREARAQALEEAAKWHRAHSRSAAKREHRDFHSLCAERFAALAKEPQHD